MGRDLRARKEGQEESKANARGWKRSASHGAILRSPMMRHAIKSSLFIGIN